MPDAATLKARCRVTPRAVAVKVATDRKGVTGVVVACPFGKPHRHVHGLPDGRIGARELRVAHCGAGSYLIVDGGASA